MHKVKGLTISQRLLELYELPKMRAFLSGGGELHIAIEQRPSSCIDELYQAGHRHFSEKYVYGTGVERLLRERTDVKLNLFGHLQRNKAKKALKSFDCIESVDSVRLAHELKRCMNNTPNIRLKEVFVQINQGEEPQKTGVLPNQAQHLIDHCLDIGLPLVGLMTIPPKGQDPIPFFKKLRQLADNNNLEHCQMGMSDDWEMALRYGATRIRIGRAIFDNKC